MITSGSHPIRSSPILDDPIGQVLNKPDADALTYREDTPPPALADVIECMWRRECWQPPTRDLGVLPDGRMDVIWTSDGKTLVMGPQCRALGRPASPSVVVIGVRFRPAMGPAVLGVPARELVNRHVPLAAIDTPAAVSLLGSLDRIEDHAAAPGVIARAVQRRLESGWVPDVAVRRATNLLRDSKASVAGVAGALELSERQLQRRFREAVGYGPKMLQRVLRFQRLLVALEDGRAAAGGLAWIAPDIGYADQAHLTRETHEFSGLSPVQLERILLALRDERASGIFKTGARRKAVPLAAPDR